MAVESQRSRLGDGRGLRRRRRQVQAALERYADLFEFGPFGLLVTDAGGTIEEANASAARMLGVPEDFLVGKQLPGFVRAKDRPAFRNRVRELAEEPVEFEVELVRGSEGRFCAELLVARAADGRGDLRWMLRDVTRRKQYEDEIRGLNQKLEKRARERGSELERQRRLLQAVVRQLPVGVIIADARSGEVLMTNDELVRTLGHPPSRGPDGRYGPYTAYHEDGTPYEPQEYPLYRAINLGEAVSRKLIPFRRVDGVAGVLEVSATPVRGRGGRIVAGVAVLQDVTEREQREQAEREFVTNAAHELQTPLTAIVSAIDVLQSGAKRTPRDRDRFLAHIEAACTRLTRLTHSLLALARAQSGVESARREAVPLRPLLDDVALGLRPAPGVVVTVRSPARLAALADRELLEQSISNLATNSAKYTSTGQIKLSAHARDDSTVVIEVADTGPGLSSLDATKAFERFYRGGDRSDNDGFGIGLAIARQAIEALGGTVELEPRRGRGTVARITLPLAAR